MLKTSLLLAAALASSSAWAAAAPARFTLDVKIEGGASQKNGENQSTSSLSEVVHLAYSLARPDAAMPYNLLDDAGNAARSNRQLAEAKARAPSPEKQAEVMRGFEAQANACKGNMQCMMELSNKMAKVTAAWNAGIPSANDDQGSFLQYMPLEGAACKPEFTARVRNGEKGQQADVGGPRPFVNKMEADFSPAGTARQVVCYSQLVQDEASGKIFVKLHMPEVKGAVQYTSAGFTQIDDRNGTIVPNAEAWAWINKQLMGAPRSGKARTTLKAPVQSTVFGKAESTVNVEISWSFTGN
jgi:hypothetical protein